MRQPSKPNNTRMGLGLLGWHGGTMKPWYTSKLVWLGIISTLIGALQLVASLLAQSTITPSDITLLIVGILGVVMRVWFTDTKIVK